MRQVSTKKCTRRERVRVPAVFDGSWFGFAHHDKDVLTITLLCEGHVFFIIRALEMRMSLGTH